MCALVDESVKVVVDYYFNSKNRIAFSFLFDFIMPLLWATEVRGILTSTELSWVAELLMGDAIGLGLYFMGRSWDDLVDGKKVNICPKTTPSVQKDHPLMISAYTEPDIFRMLFSIKNPKIMML